MTNELTNEIIKVLEDLKMDAEMAISEEWDKGNEGFEAQIVTINRLLAKLNSGKPWNIY